MTQTISLLKNFQNPKIKFTSCKSKYHMKRIFTNLQENLRGFISKWKPKENNSKIDYLGNCVKKKIE